MKFIGIIPARYASTRFPGKPLAMLGGKPVIQRVYEQVTSVLGEAYVATDDDRIFKAVESFGGHAVMTRTDHKSGTDRIEEAAIKLQTNADVIINVQGDEPFIQKSSPKIVCDVNGYAMYFSRSVIPYIRGKESSDWLLHFPFLKHIGLYAYRREVLSQITKLPQSPLELAESLEQLRWLQNGYRIKVGLTDVETVGIDTPEDLERAEQFLKEFKD
ncbi:manno-octulosonate cytidylyltransferase [uncultured Prevotella sp.]|uniref:3-deoxy-manno-octulosonate cytidylyltransferase n=1 Tax=uncultured Prevotella sp. TaxID=159272 RepID=UPI002585A079|nr:manno-octulosonate cytidylyltransferase [uncultured Prevotella sp.]